MRFLGGEKYVADLLFLVFGLNNGYPYDHINRLSDSGSRLTTFPAVGSKYYK